jgi:hypothetical protein
MSPGEQVNGGSYKTWISYRKVRGIHIGTIDMNVPWPCARHKHACTHTITKRRQVALSRSQVFKVCARLDADFANVLFPYSCV